VRSFRWNAGSVGLERYAFQHVLPFQPLGSYNWVSTANCFYGRNVQHTAVKKEKSMRHPRNVCCWCGTMCFSETSIFVLEFNEKGETNTKTQRTLLPQCSHTTIIVKWRYEAVLQPDNTTIARETWQHKLTSTIGGAALRCARIAWTLVCRTIAVQFEDGCVVLVKGINFEFVHRTNRNWKSEFNQK
jgi:hypothetical protein